VAATEGEITRLLNEWRSGDTGAFERLFPLLYPTLKRLAGRELRGERPGHTLQTTALVHEAFLELCGQQAHFTDRAHFLAVAAFVMRRILTEHARTHSAQKRGAGQIAVTLDDEVAGNTAALAEISAVDEALQGLEKVDPRAAQVVVLRFFGGLSHEDTATALGISPITVKRDWATARAWLVRALEPP
jgi:RNA polymerase sigma factor (TIGR02999 family)